MYVFLLCCVIGAVDYPGTGTWEEWNPPHNEDLYINSTAPVTVNSDVGVYKFIYCKSKLDAGSSCSIGFDQSSFISDFNLNGSLWIGEALNIDNLVANNAVLNGAYNSMYMATRCNLTSSSIYGYFVVLYDMHIHGDSYMTSLQGEDGRIAVHSGNCVIDTIYNCYSFAVMNGSSSTSNSIGCLFLGLYDESHLTVDNINCQGVLTIDDESELITGNIIGNSICLSHGGQMAAENIDCNHLLVYNNCQLTANNIVCSDFLELYGNSQLTAHSIVCNSLLIGGADQATPVPEPSTMILLSLMCVGILFKTIKAKII